MNFIVDCVAIFAGGSGTRLKPYSYKGILTPIFGIPLIFFNIKTALRLKGIRKVLILTGFNRKNVENYIKAEFKDELFSGRLELLYTGTKGTLQGVIKVFKYVQKPVIFVNGNVIFKEKLYFDLQKKFNKEGKQATVAISPFNKAPTHAQFIIKSRNLIKVEIGKSNSGPNRNYCSLGVYLLTPEILTLAYQYFEISRKDFDNLFEILRSENKLSFFIYRNSWYCFHTPADIFSIKKLYAINSRL